MKKILSYFSCSEGQPHLELQAGHSTVTTVSLNKDKKATLMGLFGLKPEQFQKPKEGGHKVELISVVIDKSLQRFHDSELWVASSGTLSKKYCGLEKSA